ENNLCEFLFAMSNPAQSPLPASPSSPPSSAKEPRPVFTTDSPSTVFAFPPNRDTLGGTAYFIVENGLRVLVDCPAWDETNQRFVANQGGADWLIITHRGGMGKVKEWQQTCSCSILVQEQEAYLLPNLELQTFHREFRLSDRLEILWTPGHSPGSSCLYWAGEGGVLFSGRHLLPNAQGDPAPLKTSKTFHWPRQLQNIRLLLTTFTAETLHFICPGANTGFLRGQRSIDRAYERLSHLALDEFAQVSALL
ncbi:MAG: hypothetical protein SFW36_11490, partial [Leptolyngbyaceae cyanobacterium bins.59]|nr:hypothetical protein [Leptolyngbyaceae cyanobacterium bins.59]